MRHEPRRRRAASALYGAFGFMMLVVAVPTRDPVPLAIAVVSFVMAPLAFTRYPIDRSR